MKITAKLNKSLSRKANAENAKYIGDIEFKDNQEEYHFFSIVQVKNYLVFGGSCNTCFLISGALKIDIPYESLDEALSELLADLECYYNDGPQYVSRILVNERM